jgi:hypothetical protein
MFCRFLDLVLHPYGILYAEWTDKWQEWALEIPNDRNPMSDVTG